MFKPNYHSFYKEYANKTLAWLPMDTEELYKKNLKKNYQLLKHNNWIDKSFTYKFNSHGFRCNEFSTDPTIMFLGCSNTVGIGLPIESIWPEIVSNQLSMNCANFGQGAGSNDTMFRLCHGWIDVINPKIIVVLNAPGIRIETVNNSTIEFLSPTWSDRHTSFLKEWGKDDNNNYFNTLKNNLAIKSMCEERKIKYIIIEDSKFFSYGIDNARDLAHLGISSNKNFAEFILNQL
jgi:hypothetical protein